MRQSLVFSLQIPVPSGDPTTINLQRRIFMPFAAALLLVPIACHRPNHADARAEARERWSEVRGRVKLQLARQQFDRRQFADAAGTLEEAIGLDATCADAYAMLAKANLELDRPATAEQVITTAWEAGLETADLHYLAGVILEQRNQHEPALSQYEKAREMNDSNVDYFVAHVECLVALGRGLDALALVDENTNRFDDQASVAILGARIAAMLGDADDAIRRYRDSSIATVQSAFATEELGLLLVSIGRCSEAVRALRPLIDEAPTSALDGGSIRRGLAHCYLSLDEPALARAVLADYAREHPDDVAAQVLLAKAAIPIGDFMTALRAIDVARHKAPDDRDIELLQATALWKRGDVKSAETVLNGLVASDPRDVDSWCLLGEVLQSANRHGDARDAFEHALAIEPDSPWAMAGIGIARRLAPRTSVDTISLPADDETTRRTSRNSR